VARVARGDAERAAIERALGEPVADTARAEWGFTNTTDIVTLAGGERVVVQRYRRRADAERRLRVMRALWEPAAGAGIALPRIREADLDAQPPWVVFDLLPGVPITAAGDAAPGGPRFPAIARAMGELLTTFRNLPAGDLELDDLWATPTRLAARAREWADDVPSLDGARRDALARLVERVPELIGGRPVVLTHGDFVPVNVLTDGRSLTGLLDFEAVRLADPAFDVAWWAWFMSFVSSEALETAWPEFLAGASIDATDPQLPARMHVLQVLRMLELLAEGTLVADVRGTVERRLHRDLR
jgi:aminoglycoside phosphotransferase (APT) family kinase protein